MFTPWQTPGDSLQPIEHDPVWLRMHGDRPVPLLRAHHGQPYSHFRSHDKKTDQLLHLLDRLRCRWLGDFL